MVSDDKLSALNAAVAEYGQAKFDEGVQSVSAPAPVEQPAPTEPTQPAEPTQPSGPTEAEIQARIDAAIAAHVAADKTTLTIEDAEKLVSEATAPLKETIATLETQLTQKDADAMQEALASVAKSMADQLLVKAQELSNMTVPAPIEPAPVEETPAEEVPAEEVPAETTPVETEEEKAARIASGK